VDPVFRMAGDWVGGVFYVQSAADGAGIMYMCGQY
jgi:hypothetical protein